MELVVTLLHCDFGSKHRSRQLLLHCSIFAHPWVRTFPNHHIVIHKFGYKSR